MTIYILDYDEDIVEPIQIPDNRNSEQDLKDMYGEYFYVYEEAKEVLDTYAKSSFHA